MPKGKYAHQTVQTKEQNIMAFMKAKFELQETLDKHGVAMKSWGKAYSYSVINALLAGRKNVKKLKCFDKKV